MSFLCNKDSFLKEHKSKVKSCQASSLTLNGQKVRGFDVVLEETIFFPEGGGQPYDTGCLGGQEVVNVRRESGQAILFVKSKEDGQLTLFEVGDEPLQQIDWHRRFDHMQHHTGQHLISALAMSSFKMDTTTWALGPEICYIEFNVPEVSEQVLTELEEACNQAIVGALPVTFSYRDVENLGEIRARMEIPDDQTGQIRIVSIGGDQILIDQNPCCGTHVSNLSQIQMIKLLYSQKGKKGKSLVYFIAGQRLRGYLGATVQRERTLAAAFKCPAEELPAMVEKAQKNIKRFQKNCLNLSRDLAQFEAEKYLKLADEKPNLYSLHRKEGEYDFISIFVNSVDKEIGPGRLILVSMADDCLVASSGGQFMLAGDEQLVNKASQIAISNFAAKGSVAKGKFRGRLVDVSKLSKLEEQIKNEVF